VTNPAEPDATAMSLDDLRRLVAAQLDGDARQVAVELDATNPAIINLKTVTGYDKRIDVGNLLGRLKHVAPADHSVAIGAFAAATLESPMSGSKDIYPTIRPSSVIDLVGEMASKNAPPQSSMIPYEMISDELVILYQFLGDGYLSAVSWSCLETTDLSALREKAVGNVERLLPSMSAREIVDGIVSYSIDRLDYLSSGLLLSDAFWNLVAEHFPDGAYVGIPTRENFVLVDRRHRGALEGARSIIQIMRNDAADQVSSEVYERVGTGLRAVGR
jgi:hypothetical protein